MSKIDPELHDLIMKEKKELKWNLYQTSKQSI